MNPLIQLKKAAPVALVCFGLLSTTQAVSPTPDGSYPGGNTAVGQNALLSRTSGIYDTAIGTYSELLLTSGNFNTGVGAGTLLLNNANENTAVGAGALLTNSTGLNNTACGTFGLFSNQTGNFNNAVGANSLLLNVDGDSNNAFGESALSANIHGDGNTAMGDFALTSNDVTGNGLGNFNAALGVAALFSNRDGDSNNAVGFHALGSNIDGSQNNAIGLDAMAFNQHGTGNVAIGHSAGLATEGSFNIYIGAFAGPAPSPAPVTESETIRIGDVSKVACYIGGIDGATVDPGSGTAVFVDADGKLGTVVSSKRFKDDVKPMDKASEAIMSLQPVTFRYKKDMDPKGVQQFGLIAEDVAKVNPNLVIRDRDGAIKTVRYDAVNAMLLNEFLKEHRKNEEQEKTIAELKSGMTVLATTVKEQAAQIQKVSAQLEASKPAPQVVNNP